MIDPDNYIEIECPVCRKFYFSKLDPEDLDFYDYVQCRKCGWINDRRQIENPELCNGENELSLNQYKKWYKKKLKSNPNYDYSEENYEDESHVCPVCGKHVFKCDNSFDVCPVCGWIDDSIMEDYPDKIGVNNISLNDYIKDFREKSK